jgi:hypothetical protein
MAKIATPIARNTLTCRICLTERNDQISAASLQQNNGARHAEN